MSPPCLTPIVLFCRVRAITPYLTIPGASKNPFPVTPAITRLVRGDTFLGLLLNQALKRPEKSTAVPSTHSARQIPLPPAKQAPPRSPGGSGDLSAKKRPRMRGASLAL